MSLLLLIGTMSVAAIPPQKNVVLSGTDEILITASNTGRMYRVFVWVPDLPTPEGGFPVLYHNDPSDHFAPLVTTMDRASETGQSGVIPAIIVGVGYMTQSSYDVAGRTRDLTPPADSYVQPDANIVWEHGGADVYLDFLVEDVRPLIESRYPVNRNHQTLYGHSYGGLFVLHTLFTRPHLFQRYAASSPSVWFNDRFILSEEKAFTEKVLNGDLALDVELQITVGSMEQTLTDAQKIASDAADRKAMKASRRMVDNTREMSERLVILRDKGVDVRYHVFEGEDHLSVMPAADARAVTFAFRNYDN